MYKIIRGLRTGINYDLLEDEEKKLINELREAKIVYNTRYKVGIFKSFSNILTFNYDKKKRTFKVFPRGVMG